MSHGHAWTRLPDLLADRDQPELLAHVAACHDCQRRLFLLGRVDRTLRELAAEQQRERRRSRWQRWFRLSPVLVAAAGVAALLLVLMLPRPVAAHVYSLHTPAGRRIGQARLSAADGENTSVLLVASGLPTGHGDQYLLWARSRQGQVPVGRFMVSRDGSCRARFNLPAAGRWTRLWVTRPGRPNVIVATT